MNLIWLIWNLVYRHPHFFFFFLSQIDSNLVISILNTCKKKLLVNTEISNYIKFITVDEHHIFRFNISYNTIYDFNLFFIFMYTTWITIILKFLQLWFKTIIVNSIDEC